MSISTSILNILDSRLLTNYKVLTLFGLLQLLNNRNGKDIKENSILISSPSNHALS